MTRKQKMEAKTISDTRGEVETEALLDTLTYILPQVKVEALVEVVVVTLVELKAETLGDSRRVGR